MITLLFILVLLVRLNFCSHGYTLFFSETFSVLRGCFNESNYCSFRLEFYLFSQLSFLAQPSLQQKIKNFLIIQTCVACIWSHIPKYSQTLETFFSTAPALIYYCLQFKVINHVFKT